VNLKSVKPGLRVKVAKLAGTRGMTIHEEHLKVRRKGVTGTVLQHVPGHGGDVWFVQHDDSDAVGAYTFTELEPTP